ncbi:MAG: nucleoside-diphosphate kinase [bacterium]
MIQKTLVVLKPDSVSRSITGEIISRFERVGLHIVGMKMLSPDKDFLFHHYETLGQMISRRGQKPFDVTVKMMMTGPVIAIVLEGVEAVEIVRKMVGTTEPKAAAPGTIRGDYAHMSFGYADSQDIGVPNLIHASGNVEEATAEIKHWFKDSEIFDHLSLHAKYTR